MRQTLRNFVSPILPEPPPGPHCEPPGGTEGISGEEALENVQSVEIVTCDHSEDIRANIQNRLDKSLVLDRLSKERVDAIGRHFNRRLAPMLLNQWQISQWK